MTMSTTTALAWPALETAGERIPNQISYERGVWGKVHAAQSDFRWIARSAAFAAQHERLELQFPFGLDEEGTSFAAWRVLGNTCYAVASYPSKATDATGRSGFMARQVLEWVRQPEMPAALGALLLLAKAAAFASSEDAADSKVWYDDGATPVEVSTKQPLTISPAALEKTIAAGLQGLTHSVSREALVELYASLLAGARAIPLNGVTAPLQPDALAALLLPLPRAIADRVSLTAWLPSSRLSNEDSGAIRRAWDVVAAGPTRMPPDPAATPPTAEQRQEAEEMANAIFASQRGTASKETPIAATQTSRSELQPIQLTLWGPSAAGKTALLAVLFLRAPDDDWNIFPTETSARFIKDMRRRIVSDNHFPKATAPGHLESIEYLFHQNRTGISASLCLEDRAGRDSENVDENADPGGRPTLKTRLASSDGLVLLFDPIADAGTLENHVSTTLDEVHLASGHGVAKDNRPIAVCVSKADVLIKTPADYRAALDTPDAFVRSRVPAALIRALDGRCSRYRLFPVSVATVRLRHGVVQRTVFVDEKLTPRITPGESAFNLMTPFSWLIQELTGAHE